jgi:hypothetical protein
MDNIQEVSHRINHRHELLDSVVIDGWLSLRLLILEVQQPP